MHYKYQNPTLSVLVLSKQTCLYGCHVILMKKYKGGIISSGAICEKASFALKVIRIGQTHRHDPPISLSSFTEQGQQNENRLKGQRLRKRLKRWKHSVL
jgi:hypothetical protein